MQIEISPAHFTIETTDDPYLVHVIYAGHFRVMQARVEPPVPEWERRRILEGALSLLTYQIGRMRAVHCRREGRCPPRAGAALRG